MNKIVEETMTNMIRRIEIIENQVKKLIDCSKPQTNFNTPGLASKAQIDYLRSLGGKVWEGITKEEAGKGIDKLLEGRKDKQIGDIIDKVVEPKEVDTEDAGLEGELM